jgi:hypothetical protein
LPLRSVDSFLRAVAPEPVTWPLPGEAVEAGLVEAGEAAPEGCAAALYD